VWMSHDQCFPSHVLNCMLGNELACQEQTRQPVVVCACRQALSLGGWWEGKEWKGKERKGEEEVNSTCEGLGGGVVPCDSVDARCNAFCGSFAFGEESDEWLELGEGIFFILQ
jgi:hypothetical protein